MGDCVTSIVLTRPVWVTTLVTTCGVCDDTEEDPDDADDDKADDGGAAVELDACKQNYISHCSPKSVADCIDIKCSTQEGKVQAYR